MARPVVVELRADGKGVVSTFRTTTREAKRMQRQFDGTSRSTEKMSRSSQSATQSFRGFYVAAAAAAASLVLLGRAAGRRADEMTRLNARMRLATDSTQEFRRAQQAVNEIAQESGRQLGAVGELYVRLQQSMKDVNAEAGEIETITRAITQSMRVSGASAAESAGAIRQLSQSFAAGVLRGDEFNSVNEQAPRLMQALADSLGITRGELRGLAEQGELTSDILRTALVEQAGEIAEESAQIPTTLGEAWTRLSNSLTGLVGVFDEATGSSQGFAGAIDRVAEKIDSAAEWVSSNMLRIRLAGIDMVRNLINVFMELRGGFDFIKAVAKEAFQGVSNAWFESVETIQSTAADFVQKFANALDLLPGFDGISEQADLAAAKLQENAAAAKANTRDLKDFEQIWEDVREDVDAGRKIVDQLAGAWTENAIAAHEAAKATGEFNDATGEANETAGEGAGINEELAKSYEGLVEQLADQIESLREEQLELRGGTEAVLNYRIAKLKASGATEEMIDTVVELRDELLAEKDALADLRAEMEANEQASIRMAENMAAIGQQAMAAAFGLKSFGDESERAAQAGQQDFGGNIARALAAGLSGDRDLVESLGNVLQAEVTNSVSQGFGDVIDNGLFDEDGDFSQGLKDAVGLSIGSGLGAALGGGSQAAQAGSNFGSMLGQAAGEKFLGSLDSFAGPVGAIAGGLLGGLIGGLFGGDDDPPRFNIGNVGDGVRTDEFANSELGGFSFGTKDLDPQKANEIVKGIQEFDKALASAIQGSGVGDEVAEALQNAFSFKSKDDGLSLEDMMQARLDAALSVMDDFIGQLVQRGSTIEDQLERLASVFAIERELFFGRGLGLTGEGLGNITPPSQPGPRPGQPTPPGGGRPPGPPGTGFQLNAIEEFNAVVKGTGDAADVSSPALRETLFLVEELSRPSENLAETFRRLQVVTNSLDTAFDLIGSQFEGSRQDLVRFGDDLVKLFGDDMEALAGRLNRIFDTFFTDEERAGVQAQQATTQATSLLEQAGIDVTADMLTLEGFRNLWDEMFTELGPENQALLIEAGNAVADLIDAEERLADARGETSAEMRRQAEELADLTSSVNQQLLEHLSPAHAQLNAVMSSFNDMMAQARELGASEQTLMRIRQLHSAQLTAMAASLRASITDSVSQLFGSGQDSMGESMDRTAGQVGGAMQDIQNSMIDAIKGVQDWLDQSTLSDTSPLMPAERLAEARSQFEQTISAARSNDAEAASELPNLADQFLSEASSFYGASTAEFDRIWMQVREAMQGVAGMDLPEAPSAQPTFEQTQTIADASQTTANNSYQRVQQASQLIGQIDTLSRITGDTPADIAEELGVPMGELIDLMGGTPEATAQALESQFNDLVGGFGEVLNPLMGIERSQLSELRAINLSFASLSGFLSTERQTALETISKLPNQYIEPPPEEDPPVGRARGGWTTGIVNTGEEGPELILDNHVSEFFRRNGVPVNGGGSDPQARALLAKIEKRLARIEEQDRTRTAEQIRAIREGASATTEPLNELVVIEQEQRNTPTQAPRRFR